MKRILLILCVAAACMAQAATAFPDLGNARIIVLANNLQNYYINYDESDRPSYDDEQGLALKTQRIVSMMVASNADIFAFCEVEAKPASLDRLVSEINTQLGSEVYASVYDGMNIATDSYDNAIKSGFIYRIATVEPYGNNYAATNFAYYRNVMRIQAWTELSTGERFTLSMNHFKAKSDDISKAKRIDNATWLMNALSSSSKVKDPDILIVGDLNCQMEEEAITIIVNNDYEEQLLRFDEDAYSYIYKGNHELIDHAFANETMAAQITGAAVWHTNTSVSYSQRYSDHDAVLVGLRLGDEPGEAIEITTDNTLPATHKIIRHGQIIIIRGGEEYSITGQRLY